MTSFKDRIDAVSPIDRENLRVSGSDFAVANTSMRQLGEARNQAFVVARQAAKSILNQICSNDDVPLMERAAWSAAFHGRRQRDIAGVDDFAVIAADYHRRLKSIDELLSVNGAPILGFVTGKAGDTIDDRKAIQYAYRTGDGSGLIVAQRYNDGQDFYYHQASAGVQPSDKKLRSLDLYRPGKGPIDETSTDVLAEAWTTPQNAVEALLEPPEKPKLQLVIGQRAVNALFRASGSSPNADLLLGHAVYLGFRPDF